MDNYMKTIVSGIKTWASSIKSDWNENDPSADGYIKNRPFWTSDPIKKVLLGETSVEIAEDNGYVQISNAPMFDIGTTYYVTFNGVEYECVAYDMWDAPVVGNGYLAGGSGGNEEPFLVVGGYNFIYASEAGTHTVDVLQIIDGEVHKIDKKYLPDLSNVGTQPDWNVNDETNPAYILNRPFYIGEGISIPHETTGIASSGNYEVVWTMYPQAYHGLVKVENNNGFKTSDFVGATILKGSASLDDFTVQQSDVDEFGNIIAIDENRLFVFVSEGNTATWTSPSGSTKTFSEGIWIPAWTFLNGYYGFSAGVKSEESIVSIDPKYLPEHNHYWNDLEDKPFGEGDPVETETVLIDETSVAINEDGGYTDISSSLTYEIGAVYTVVFDGVRYECVAYQGSGNAIIIGNGDIYGGGNGGNGEPFSSDSYPDGSAYLNVQTSGTHTVSISQTKMVPSVNTLDNKYLDFMEVEEPYVVIPEQEVVTQSKTYIGYCYCFDDVSAVDFSHGATYTVTVNGTEYKCIASVTTDVNGYPDMTMGNLTVQNMNAYAYENTGEPFCIYSGFPADGVIYFVTEEAGTYTIEVRFDGLRRIKEDVLIQSDWNVNNSNSAAYIQNRPFYTGGGDIIQWDGNMDGLSSVCVGMNYYAYGPISGYSHLTAQDFIGAEVPVDTEGIRVLTEDDLSDDGLSISYFKHFQGGGMAFVGEGSSITVDGNTISEPGLWIGVYGNASAPSAPPETPIKLAEKIVQIDEKYLPDTMATKEYVDERCSNVDIDLSDYIKQVYLVDDGAGNVSLAASCEAAPAAEGVEF